MPSDLLNLLASEVNGGNGFAGKFFKLDSDITYSHTTAWDDDTSKENNYSAIGTNKDFHGTFDGRNHTVSGIRIYNDRSNLGLFGSVYDGTVKNIFLCDTRITGGNETGGIVGRNELFGTVDNCHVAATVTIQAISGKFFFGGIVGNNSGCARNCSSSAVVTTEDGGTDFSNLGGIAGSNYGTISNCTAAGAVVATVTNAGAIVGSNDIDATLSGNTYHSCLVGTNAFNIGVGFHGKAGNPSGERGDRAGATLGNQKLFLFDERDNSALLAAYQEPSTHTGNSGTAPTVSNLAVTLQGHTFYKDGTWNTLCLPFDVSNLSGTPLEGASVYGLSTTGTNLNTTTGALTLAFSPVTSIEAGKPYIVKWASGSDVVNPVFSGVKITNSDPSVISSSDGRVKFAGQYGPFEINDSNRSSIIFVDGGNKVGYSQADRTLPAFGARFQAQGVSTVTVDFGDGTGTRHLTGHLSDGVYWATYYNQDVRFTLPEGAQAYTMGSDHKLYRLGDDGRVIPKNTAVVIISDVSDIELTSSEDASPIAIHGPDSKNILLGGPVTVTNGKVPVPGSDPAATGTPYVLGVAGNPAALGFYKYTGDAIPTNKAYYVQ